MRGIASMIAARTSCLHFTLQASGSGLIVMMIEATPDSMRLCAFPWQFNSAEVAILAFRRNKVKGQRGTLAVLKCIGDIRSF